MCGGEARRRELVSCSCDDEWMYKVGSSVPFSPGQSCPAFFRGVVRGVHLSKMPTISDRTERDWETGSEEGDPIRIEIIIQPLKDC